MKKSTKYNKRKKLGHRPIYNTNNCILNTLTNIYDSFSITVFRLYYFRYFACKKKNVVFFWPTWKVVRRHFVERFRNIFWCLSARNFPTTFCTNTARGKEGCGVVLGGVGRGWADGVGGAQNFILCPSLGTSQNYLPPLKTDAHPMKDCKLTNKLSTVSNTMNWPISDIRQIMRDNLCTLIFL